MARLAPITAVLVATSFIAAAGPNADAGAKKDKKDEKIVSREERLALIRRAQVWIPTNVAAMDLAAGPQGRGAFKPGQTVTCAYDDEKFTGSSPKFGCIIGEDDKPVKVKYGRNNGEVYGGVAATRLLWALGFGADILYPVHVVCRGCPPNLQDDSGIAADGEVRFDFAAIERKMPGREIESADGPGWSWPELDLVDRDAGGAPGAQRDALKLLAVMLQHTDNKREQQRLICLGENKNSKSGTDGGAHAGDCARPFMMIHDLGQTFGRSNLFNRQAPGSVNYEEWARTPVWVDAPRCIGNLPPSQTGTLTNPEISEAGRRFLANLLRQLSDRQLRDLFTAARFAEKPIPGTASPTVEMWVGAFKNKRAEIANARCPF